MSYPYSLLYFSLVLCYTPRLGGANMSKEFEALKKFEEDEKAKHREAYHYARSLGFSARMAQRLANSSKERIQRLSKEL